MPIREYICLTKGCVEHTEDMAKIKELLVGLNEEPECEVCGGKLEQIINQPCRGRVRYSENPVRQ